MIKHSMKAVAIATVVGGMIAGAVSASAALNLPTQNCAFSFSSNMKQGSRGSSVMDLQKVLNLYPQTQVTASGAGSPGLETSTFGPATRAAVNKFQALHLVELGITAPTGNVFAGTRGLLNQVCTGTVSTNPGNPGPVSTGPVSASLSGNQPTGMIVAGQSGARLADITFTGNGTVTSVQLQRTGVSADSILTNVYLYNGNTRITDAASVVTGGFINFNASAGLFTVSGSRTVTVRADIIASTVSNPVTGQSVGVKLNSVTAGGAASTYSNVVGNQLSVASISTLSTANITGSIGTLADNTLKVDAGTSQYNVWSGNVAIGNRAANLRAATFKFVGSAPVDSLQNINLYVDGAKVSGPASINALNNNKVTFDLGNTPYLLTTGSHTFDVRADIVKGSFRTITMSIENVADLMLEDSQLSGVNISATSPNSSTAFTQSGVTFGQITVNKGSVTVNVDPAFSANKVTGGATNVPVGQFTLKAFGEDVKVNTLKVDFITASPTATSTLNNVSLYVNGGQVGTNQNFTGTAASSTGLTYNLGSSLIIPAGQTVTLTVKADIVDVTGAAYTTGSVSTVLGRVANNAQGQSSNELFSVAGSGVTGNVLSVSSGAGTFARTSGFTGVTKAPNTAGVQIGSFTLQANSAEAVKVNSIGVNPVPTTYGITNLSNLTVKTGSTVLGTPVGNPSAGTSTFSFNDITVPANGTITFDVYADLGGATSGSVNAAMSVTTHGAVSNTTVVSSANGVAISSAASTLAASSLQSSSPVAQFVVGGSTFGIATYKVSTAAAGTQAIIREMRFATAGTDAISTITVGGVTATVLGSGATATTSVTGLSIPVGSTGTDIPVLIKYSGFQNTTSGGSLLSSVPSVSITLSHIEGTSGSGSIISDETQVPSNTMTLVASKPTVTVGSGSGSGQVILGVENKIGEFTVTADANGKIGVASTSLAISTQNITNPEISGARVADGNATITGAIVSGSSTVLISFDTAVSPSFYEIGAGQSKTFSVFAVVAGAQNGTNAPYVTSRMTSASSFQWVDVLGGTSAAPSLQTGSLIFNFPTSSFVTTH